jgi:hypothetical protein
MARRLLAALVILAGLALVALVIIRPLVTDCRAEDQMNCTWLATDHGGRGESFTSWSFFGDHVFVQIRR